MQTSTNVFKVRNIHSLILGEEAVDDLRQSSGFIYYVSNEGRQVLVVEVLADEVPEGTEVNK